MVVLRRASMTMLAVVLVLAAVSCTDDGRDRIEDLIGSNGNEEPEPEPVPAPEPVPDPADDEGRPLLAWFMLVLALLSGVALISKAQRRRRESAVQLAQQQREVLAMIDWLIDVSGETPPPGTGESRARDVRLRADGLHDALSQLALQTTGAQSRAVLALRDAVVRLTDLSVERVHTAQHPDRDLDLRIGEQRERVRMHRDQWVGMIDPRRGTRD